jgi:ABC-type uncharacterized transport system ATPase subunit
MAASSARDLPKSEIALTSVHFRNFKALQNFSVTIQRMNMLVGASNAGKSTIIGAFRVLSGAVLRARIRRPEWLHDLQRWGYRVAEENIPFSFSIENIHTNYADVDSSAIFHLSNRRTLTLLFPVGGGCVLLPDTHGRRIVHHSRFHARASHYNRVCSCPRGS